MRMPTTVHRTPRSFRTRCDSAVYCKIELCYSHIPLPCSSFRPAYKDVATTAKGHPLPVTRLDSQSALDWPAWLPVLLNMSGFLRRRKDCVDCERSMRSNLDDRRSPTHSTHGVRELAGVRCWSDRSNSVGFMHVVARKCNIVARQ